jgi:hypothetical protein
MIEPERRLLFRSPWLLALLPLAVAIVARAGIVSEADAFWGARAGVDWLEGSGISHVDTWSWASGDKVWMPNSWLWNVVLGAAWRAFGYAGFGLVVVVTSVVIFGFMARQAERRGAGAYATGAACLVGMLALSRWLSPRPQVATYLAVLAVVALAAALVQTGPKRRVALLATALTSTQAVAVNLHMGALSTVPLVVCGAGLWLAFDRHPVRFRWCRFALAVTAVNLGSCAGPLGWGIYAHALMVREESAGLIKEWRPGWHAPLFVVVVLLGAFCVRQAFRNQRFVVAGAIACSLVTFVSALRFEPFVLLLCVPELAVAFAALQQRSFMRQMRPLLLAFVFVFVAVFVPNVIETVRRPGYPAATMFSVDAMNALPRDCKAFNSDLDGGLITLIRPDVKTSTDGRNDLFGREAVKRNAQIIQGRIEGLSWVEQQGVDCIILSKVSRTGPFLDDVVASGRWNPVFADRFSIVFERTR